MKLPVPPIVSDTDFERLLKLERAENTTLRHYGEMWKAVALLSEPSGSPWEPSPYWASLKFGF